MQLFFCKEYLILSCYITLSILFGILFGISMFAYSNKVTINESLIHRFHDDFSILFQLPKSNTVDNKFHADISDYTSVRFSLDVYGKYLLPFDILPVLQDYNYSHWYLRIKMPILSEYSTNEFYILYGGGHLFYLIPLVQ